jgi:erythromycin esterase-like protein
VESTVTSTRTASVALDDRAHPLRGDRADYDGLIDLIGDRRLVLIGEASHGTHEFYEERARLTQRLIEEHGFTAVAVEADWPDAYRVNRYVLGQSGDESAQSSLSDFRRFPAWMWRNTVVERFVDWLRSHNDRQSSRDSKAGFYGLDLYSLRTSIEAVIEYLDRVDPLEARRARERYGCFDHVGANGQAYGYALAYEPAIPCENQVVAQLLSLRRKGPGYVSSDGRLAEDDLFAAEQNALLVRDAEEYYQQMFRASERSWNLRDRHMAATLDALVDHLDRTHGHHGRHSKVVVWEHNSHVGDARATAMSARGEFNVGQLTRQRHGTAECVLIGMTTYAGRVTAATDWGQPPHRFHVRPAMPESYESLLHDVPRESFWLSMADAEVHRTLDEPRLERAIGVVYRPDTERVSHYFPARLTEQFDAVIHIDTTSAVEPLEREAMWDRGEPPETYPTGI